MKYLLIALVVCGLDALQISDVISREPRIPWNGDVDPYGNRIVKLERTDDYPIRAAANGGQWLAESQGSDTTGRTKRQTTWCHFWYHTASRYGVSLAPNPVMVNPHAMLLGSGTSLTLNHQTESIITVPHVWSTDASALYWLCWRSQFLQAVSIKLESCQCGQNTDPMWWPRSIILSPTATLQWQCIDFRTANVPVGEVKRIELFFYTWYPSGTFNIQDMFAIMQCDNCGF